MIWAWARCWDEWDRGPEMKLVGFEGAGRRYILVSPALWAFRLRNPKRRIEEDCAHPTRFSWGCIALRSPPEVLRIAHRMEDVRKDEQCVLDPCSLLTSAKIVNLNAMKLTSTVLIGMGLILRGRDTARTVGSPRPRRIHGVNRQAMLAWRE